MFAPKAFFAAPTARDDSSKTETTMKQELSRRIAIAVTLFSCALLFQTAYSQKVGSEKSSQQLYNQLNPSVVTIYSYDRGGNPIATGSGVILSSDGLVLTNLHVVQGGIFFDIKTSSSDDTTNVYPARPEKESTDQDLAILRFFPNNPLKPVIIDTTVPSIGQRVIAIGSPFELEGTLSEGIVSQIRTIEKQTWIQTTVQISPGSSGGGLFTTDGKLVGITTMTIKGGQGLNFAIACQDLSRLARVDHFRNVVEPNKQFIDLGDFRVNIGMSREEITHRKPSTLQIQDESPGSLRLFRLVPPTLVFIYFTGDKVTYARKSLTSDTRAKLVGSLIDLFRLHLHGASKNANVSYQTQISSDGKTEWVEVDFGQGKGIGFSRTVMEMTAVDTFDLKDVYEFVRAR